MRKPIAYIKDREIAYMTEVKELGAKEWHTNLGLVPEEGDVPLYEGKEWVSLTDDEIADAVGSPVDEVYLEDFRKVEAKLKEKNHVS
jgi:hypothetical protein